jgi:hypothetical protein
MMWSVVFVNTIKAINICIIKLCSKLFLGSLDMVGCYIMRRYLAKRRLSTKKMKVIGLKLIVCVIPYFYFLFWFFSHILIIYGRFF